MSYQHRELASGRWGDMPLVKQMANVGSEVERALKWRSRNNSEYSMRAFERALELLDLTIDSCKNNGHFRELTRSREAIADFFVGQNQFRTSEDFLRSYFLQFAHAAHKAQKPV